MSDLLSAIKIIDTEAAQVLDKADFCTDSDIRTLTRPDLNELFPGAEKLKLRKRLFEEIQKEEPLHVPLKQAKEIIPDESLRAAPANSGDLDDCLNILKELKTRTNHLLDSHIKRVEEKIREDTSQRDSGKGPTTRANSVPYQGQTDGRRQGTQYGSYGATSGMSATGSTGGQSDGQTEEFTHLHREEAQDCPGPSSSVPHQNQTDGRRQGAQYGSYAAASGMSATGSTGGQSEGQRKYKMVVSGKTFDAHQQILDKLKDQVELTESSDNPKITILFCVISSRVGSDVEAAMAEVKGDKQVILVLMHHLREPTVTASVTTWGDKYDNILFHDNVFYHETVKGLVKCRENDEAFSRIKDKLLEFFPRRRVYTRGQSNQAVDAGREKGGSKSGKYDKDKGSDKKSGSKWSIPTPW